MSTHRFVRPAARATAILSGLAVAATLVASAAGASGRPVRPASRPAAGVIHVYLTDTSNTSQTTKVLITGAFADHGIGKKATLYLQRGTITVDPSKLTAKLNASSFGHFNLNSCSFWGSATAPVPVVSGTGAYKGLMGTLTTTATIAGQGSLLKNGKCNTANSAPSVGSLEVIVANGKVHF